MHVMYANLNRISIGLKIKVAQMPVLKKSVLLLSILLHFYKAAESLTT